MGACLELARCRGIADKVGSHQGNASLAGAGPACLAQPWWEPTLSAMLLNPGRCAATLKATESTATPRC